MSDVLLSVDSLAVHFAVRAEGLIFGRPQLLRAVDDVSFEIATRETLGIVGESGCGKTTLARAILNLVPKAAGTVVWAGEDLAQCSPARLRQLRRDMQIVFQDPLGSLNPRMKIGDIIAEPLMTLDPDRPRSQMLDVVKDIMIKVGLDPQTVNRYPHEFSGGQCQRVGIARAMVLRPKLLICDEPVSALDVSVQAQILNLLSELQREFGLAMVFISHDLAVVRYVSSRILVLYLGKVMELAHADELFSEPLHPYTRALIDAVPVPDPSVEYGKPHPGVGQDLPSLLQPPGGCVFRKRCAKATGICRDKVPALEQVNPGRSVACHHWKKEECGDG